jgi:hypothetical protein
MDRGRWTVQGSTQSDISVPPTGQEKPQFQRSKRVATDLDNVYTFVYYEKSGVMAELSFEWDEEKNAANIKNHGIDFLDAALIFVNPTIEAIDDRADYRRDAMHRAWVIG